MLKSTFSFVVLGFHQRTNERLQRIRWEDHPAFGQLSLLCGDLSSRNISSLKKKKAFLFFIHPLLISTCLSEWLMKEYESWVNFTLQSPLKPGKEGRISRAAQAVLLDADITFDPWDFFFVFLGSAQVNSLNLSLSHTHTHTNTKGHQVCLSVTQSPRNCTSRCSDVLPPKLQLYECGLKRRRREHHIQSPPF